MFQGHFQVRVLEVWSLEVIYHVHKGYILPYKHIHIYIYMYIFTCWWHISIHTLNHHTEKRRKQTESLGLLVNQVGGRCLPTFEYALRIAVLSKLALTCPRF